MPSLTTRTLHRQVRQGCSVPDTLNCLSLAFRKGWRLVRLLLLKSEMLQEHVWRTSQLPHVLLERLLQVRRHLLVAKLHLRYDNLLDVPEDVSFCRWLLPIFWAVTNTDGCNLTNVLRRKLKGVCCSPTGNRERLQFVSWRLVVTCLIWTLS